MILDAPFEVYYRPKTVEEVILPQRIRKVVDGIRQHKSMPHLIFHAYGAGVGKTSLAFALAKELKCKVLSLNGGELKSETVRDLEVQLSSAYTNDVLGSYDFDLTQTLSFDTIVLIDEFDRAPNLAQELLKTLMDRVEDRVKFIFTTNYVHKLDHHVKERSTLVNFTLSQSEQVEITQQVVKLIKRVCDDVGMQINAEAVKLLLRDTMPSIRNIMIVLEAIATFDNKQFTVESVKSWSKTVSFEDYYIHLKKRDYLAIESWFSENIHHIGSGFYRDVYKTVTRDLMGRIKSDISLYPKISEFLKCIKWFNVHHGTAEDMLVHLMALSSEIIDGEYYA